MERLDVLAAGLAVMAGMSAADHFGFKLSAVFACAKINGVVAEN